MALTPKMTSLLIYIHEYTQTHGYAPSYAEMMLKTGRVSRGSLKTIIDRLVEGEWLRREAYRCRGLTVSKLPPGYATGLYTKEQSAAFNGIKFVVNENVPEGEIWVATANQIVRLVGIGGK